jgi:hypothetical protein
MSTAPEDRTDPASSLCSYGPRPLLLTGILRLLLTDHFSSAANFEHDQLALYQAERVWTADESTTAIRIEDALTWTPEISGLKPAIIIKQNDYDVLHLGLADVSGTTPQGFTEHTVLWKGSHTLFCLSKEGAEAVILGQEVGRYLLHFGNVFRKEFKLHSWKVMQMGAPAKIKELPGKFGVPVTVSICYEDSWILHQHTPLLKTLAVGDVFPSLRPYSQ